MLAVGDGDLWMMSTPWGQRGFFHRTWMEGGDEWFRVSVKATECPRIPAEYLDAERREMDSPASIRSICASLRWMGWSISIGGW